MNIVYASDNNFADIMGVSILSLYENNRDAGEITTYVIDDGISFENKHKLLSVAYAYRRDVVFIGQPDIGAICGTKLDVRRWPASAYTRLFLTRVLPVETSKALYLDSDTIITKSLAGLYSESLEHYLAAGVLAPFDESSGHRVQIGLMKEDRYFNSGVLLLNLSAMRDNNTEREFAGYIRSFKGAVSLPDQGVMNAAIGQAIKAVPPAYNATTNLFYFPTLKALYGRYRPTGYYEEAQFADAVASPAIIHYTQSPIYTRPWIAGSNHPLAEEWLGYKRLSPWAETPLRNASLPARTRLMRRLQAMWVLWPIPYGARKACRQFKNIVTTAR